MKTIRYPDYKQRIKQLQRPAIDNTSLNDTIKQIFADVKNNGDKAIKTYTEQFDGVSLASSKVDVSEIKNATKKLAPFLKQAIQVAKRNIEKFHRNQLTKPQLIETTKGVYCWRENRAIDKIGIYIPGGTAPLFSTILMLGIPAKLAGCKQIILCTPPCKKAEIHPAILYTAKLIGIDTIYRVGGAQAIAALTFGTGEIPKVDKIFGPGNQFVTAAKQAAQNYGVAIDLPAGPSEVLVIADETCVPEFVAADLLSQAEHGTDSQVMLVTDNEKIIVEVLIELAKQLKTLPRKNIAKQALKNSRAILFHSLNECMEFSNEYAPEHLIIATANAQRLAKKVKNAGSVFIGNYSCESAGDYASGTNHTLPTSGYAKQYSGISIDSFVKKITFQKLTHTGINNLGPAIEIMAEAEGLMAHKNAVSIRLNKK